MNDREVAELYELYYELAQKYLERDDHEALKALAERNPKAVADAREDFAQFYRTELNSSEEV